MSISSLLFTLIVMAFILFVSGVGIVFFGEWAWTIISDLIHHQAL